MVTQLDLGGGEVLINEDDIHEKVAQYFNGIYANNGHTQNLYEFKYCLGNKKDGLTVQGLFSSTDVEKAY